MTWMLRCFFRIQAGAFCNFFKDNPDSLLRMVQVSQSLIWAPHA